LSSPWPLLRQADDALKAKGYGLVALSRLP